VTITQSSTGARGSRASTTMPEAGRGPGEYGSLGIARRVPRFRNSAGICRMRRPGGSLGPEPGARPGGSAAALVLATSGFWQAPGAERLGGGALAGLSALCALRESSDQVSGELRRGPKQVSRARLRECSAGIGPLGQRAPLTTSRCA
jgi:hypothetical protein